MLCSSCGTEIGDAVDCTACRSAADPESAPNAPELQPVARRALFSPAWLELRVRSVFVNTPRGFSGTFNWKRTSGR
jgi:hypothetical protein